MVLQNVCYDALFFFFPNDIRAALTLKAIIIVGGRSFVFSTWTRCIFRVLETWCVASDLNPFLNEMEEKKIVCKPWNILSVLVCFFLFNGIGLFTDCLK